MSRRDSAGRGAWASAASSGSGACCGR
uniref:Uncharacterized protein n=1 Tax=Arundo donax TaxID=35708 RepID=A0A0A9HQT5_ARUDO